MEPVGNGNEFCGTLYLGEVIERICRLLRVRPVAMSEVRLVGGEACILLLPRHFEDNFQLDRGAERKARDAIHQTARALLFSEDALKRHSISGLIPDLLPRVAIRDITVRKR